MRRKGGKGNRSWQSDGDGAEGHGKRRWRRKVAIDRAKRRGRRGGEVKRGNLSQSFYCSPFQWPFDFWYKGLDSL